MAPEIKKSVRVLLLNDNNELLLMCIEGLDIASVAGKQRERFWCTVGGGIEFGETVPQAALREIYEETGIAKDDVKLGPVVWYGEVDLIVNGQLQRKRESYIVARTGINTVFLHRPTEEEEQVVKKLQWFSCGEIAKSSEMIFPVILPEVLPEILLGHYPEKPVKICLD